MFLPNELKYLVKEKIPFLSNDSPIEILEEGVSTTNLPLINWLISTKGIAPVVVLDMGLYECNLQLLIWIHNKYPNITINNSLAKETEFSFCEVDLPIECIIKAGKLDILKFLHHSHLYLFTKKDTHYLDLADAYDHISIVLWLHDEIKVPFSFDNYYNYSYAVKKDCIELLRWLHNKGEIPENHHFINAASKGFIDVLEWFHTNYPELCTKNINTACHLAAYNGYLYSLQWIIKNYRYELTCSNIHISFRGALKNNHLHCADFLHHVMQTYQLNGVEKELYQDTLKYKVTGI